MALYPRKGPFEKSPGKLLPEGAKSATNLEADQHGADLPTWRLLCSSLLAMVYSGAQKHAGYGFWGPKTLCIGYLGPLGYVVPYLNH